LKEKDHLEREVEDKARENEELTAKVQKLYEIFANSDMDKEAIEEVFKQTFNQ